MDAIDDAEPPRRDALDRLTRSGSGPAARRRPNGPRFRSAGPGSATLRESTARWLTDRWPIIRFVVPLGAVGLIVVAVLAWGGVKRPASPEDRLPRATPDSSLPTDLAEVSAASTTAAPTATTGSGPSAPPTSGLPGTVGSSAPPVTVHVAGAVAAPGVVTLPSGSRVVDAVAAARGMTAQADPDRVNLAAPVTDGARIFIPVIGQPPVETTPVGPDGGGASAAAGAGTSAPSPTNRIDLNAATAEQLEALPGVGPATAAAIVSHRETHGGFKRPEDLLDVRGIGAARFDALRELVTVG